MLSLLSLPDPSHQIWGRNTGETYVNALPFALISVATAVKTQPEKKEKIHFFCDVFGVLLENFCWGGGKAFICLCCWLFKKKRPSICRVANALGSVGRLVGTSIFWLRFFFNNLHLVAWKTIFQGVFFRHKTDDFF